MYPWLVLGSPSSDIGPVTWVACVQEAPPSGEEMKPTLSWHVDVLQLALG